MLARRFASVALGLLSRSALDLLDPDAPFAIFSVNGCAPDCCRKTGSSSSLDLEKRFIGGNADCPNLCPGDVATPAQQRKQPPWIGIVAPTDIHPEPDGILKAGPWALRPL